MVFDAFDKVALRIAVPQTCKFCKTLLLHAVYFPRKIKDTKIKVVATKKKFSLVYFFVATHRLRSAKSFACDD